MDLSLVNPGVSLSNLWFTQVHFFLANLLMQLLVALIGHESYVALTL